MLRRESGIRSSGNVKIHQIHTAYCCDERYELVTPSSSHASYSAVRKGRLRKREPARPKRHCTCIALEMPMRGPAMTSMYGAASSLMAILVWVYYSALIFFLGAEFTYVYAHQYGSRRPAHSRVS